MANVSCRVHLLTAAPLIAISLVGLSEHLLGNPVVTLFALKVMSVIGGEGGALTIAAMLGLVASLLPEARPAFYFMGSFVAFTFVSAIVHYAELPLLPLFTAAWAAPAMSAAASTASGR